MPGSIQELMSKAQEAFQPEKAAGLEAVIQFHFSGAEAGDWTAEVKGGKLSISRGRHPAPRMTIQADAGDFLKLAGGELDPMQAFLQGRLKVSGDMSLAMTLLQLFNAR